MFSKACEYAIKACIYIAKENLSGNIVAVKEISAAVNAPEAFTAKILQQLSKSGLLLSVRGKQGGFYFNNDKLKTIKVFDIIKIIDGEGIFVNCGLGLKQCSADNPCPVHEEFKVVRDHLFAMSHKFSLEDLALKTEQGIFFLKS